MYENEIRLLEFLACECAEETEEAVNTAIALMREAPTLRYKIQQYEQLLHDLEQRAHGFAEVIYCERLNLKDE